VAGCMPVTQARQIMGLQAAATVVSHTRGEEVTQDFSFEMFAHVTEFFSFKVILLGLFNGQKLDQQYNILPRTFGHSYIPPTYIGMAEDVPGPGSPVLEYVKVILKDGRMQGAVLIGDTNLGQLEETFENLILN